MTTEFAIVRKAIDGDERAMRMLWHQHASRVEAIVRRYESDPDRAQDISQEVWIQIFRALPSWRGDASLGTWIHRIAINRTLNALRRARPDGFVEVIADDTVLVEPEAERRLLAHSIEEAVRHLPPGARTVFLLHDVEGYTHEEIAAELGISVGGSKSQLFKARARLRRLLAPLLDAGEDSMDQDRRYATP